MDFKFHGNFAIPSFSTSDFITRKSATKLDCLIRI